MRCERSLLVGLVSGFLLGTPTSADVVTIEPVKDNTLYESSTGSLSNGAGQHFFVGLTRLNLARRGLLAFDIAGKGEADAEPMRRAVELAADMARATASLL